MASKTCFFLVALFCTARGNPLALGDAAAILPNLLPNTGGTTVCESTPNVLGLGYGPLGLNLPLLPPYGLPVSGLGSTTVCDSKSNIGLPYFPPYGLPMQGVGSTTVCDSKPNYALPLLPPYGLPLPGVGSTTVCESTPNMPALPYPFPCGLPLQGGSTTVCDTSPNVVSPLGVPIPGYGSTTVCDSTPNYGSFFLPPYYGYPYQRIPGINPFGGLGLPYGLPLSGLAVSPLGVPVL